MPPHTPLLDTVNSPADTRALSIPELRQLADELRAETIDAVSVTGGHLGAGLGVVELTVALHHVFETPERHPDLGRRPPGLSAQDPHRPARPHPHPAPGRRPVRASPSAPRANTTRSARPTPPPRSRRRSASPSRATCAATTTRSIAVIGDGSMSAGMAYEAMNNAAETTKQLIVILNDNDMSIAPPVGGMSAYLARPGLRRRLPVAAQARQARRRRPAAAAEGGRAQGRGIRPRHGHRRHLLRGAGLLLRRPDRRPQPGPPGPGAEERRARSSDRPVLVHVVTQKGKGYAPGRERRRQVPRRGQVRRHHRQAGQGAVQRAQSTPRCSPTS